MNQRTIIRSARPLAPLVLAVTTLALVLALVLVLRASFDPLARDQAAAEARRNAQITAAVQPVDVFATALWRLLPIVLLTAGAGVGLAIAWRRWGWRESIGAHYLIEAERAKNPPLPAALQHLNFAPHAATKTERPALTSGAALLRQQDEAEPAEDEDAPAFAGLLTSGQIGRTPEGKAQPLILGYHQGAAITGDWRSLYSSGLGGLQGSGKTWTAAYLLSQSTLAGAKLVICDPHAGDEESLAARVQALAPAFLCDIAEDERSILNALKYADSILQKRKNGDPDRTPVIVAIDEWSALRRGELADLLPLVVENFSTEGRKLQCHIMLMGQRWDKRSVGDFRNTLASSYVHRMRPDEARMMTGLRASALPDDTLQLPPGCAYLLDTRGSVTRVQIPLMTAADMQAVGAQLAGMGQPTKATSDDYSMTNNRPSMGFQAPLRQSQNSHRIVINQPATALDYSAPESQIVNTPEASRIVALFLAGKDAGAIVTELTGMTSKAGKPYITKLGAVQAVIREALLRRQNNGSL